MPPACDCRASAVAMPLPGRGRGERDRRAGAAAERAGCETALALAKVHEVWDCVEEDWRNRRWRWQAHEEEGNDELDADTPGGADVHTLGDLILSEVTLSAWLAGPGSPTAPATHT